MGTIGKTLYTYIHVWNFHYIFFSYPRRFSSAIAIGFPKRCTIAHIHDLFATFRYLKYMYIMNKAPETATNRSSCKSLKGHFCSQNRFFFRFPDFDLKPAQILENVPSPVLAKSPAGIGEIANWYWPNRQPVLTKSPTGIGQIANRYWPKHQTVLVKSYTGLSWKFLIDLQN